MARKAGPGGEIAKRVLAWVRIALFGAASAVVGTLISRSGADGPFPWGLLLSLLLVFSTSLLARKSRGVSGVGAGLAISSALAWILALFPGAGRSVLVPASSPAFTTFFSAHAGYIWLFGMIAAQVLAALLPGKWFSQKITSRP